MSVVVDLLTRERYTLLTIFLSVCDDLVRLLLVVDQVLERLLRPVHDQPVERAVLEGVVQHQQLAVVERLVADVVGERALDPGPVTRGRVELGRQTLIVKIKEY